MIKHSEVEQVIFNFSSDSYPNAGFTLGVAER